MYFSVLIYVHIIAQSFGRFNTPRHHRFCGFRYRIFFGCDRGPWHPRPGSGPYVGSAFGVGVALSARSRQAMKAVAAKIMAPPSQV